MRRFGPGAVLVIISVDVVWMELRDRPYRTGPFCSCVHHFDILLVIRQLHGFTKVI